MTDLYWDEVLLTNNPDSKELEVSFKKIDGDGFLLSQGGEPGTDGGTTEGPDGSQPDKDDEGDWEDDGGDGGDGGGGSGGPIDPVEPPPECKPAECPTLDENGYIPQIQENPTLLYREGGTGGRTPANLIIAEGFEVAPPSIPILSDYWGHHWKTCTNAWGSSDGLKALFRNAASNTVNATQIVNQFFGEAFQPPGDPAYDWYYNVLGYGPLNPCAPQSVISYGANSLNGGLTTYIGGGGPWREPGPDGAVWNQGTRAKAATNGLSWVIAFHYNGTSDVTGALFTVGLCENRCQYSFLSGSTAGTIGASTALTCYLKGAGAGARIEVEGQEVFLNQGWNFLNCSVQSTFAGGGKLFDIQDGTPRYVLFMETTSAWSLGGAAGSQTALSENFLFNGSMYWNWLEDTAPIYGRYSKSGFGIIQPLQYASGLAGKGINNLTVVTTGPYDPGLLNNNALNNAIFPGTVNNPDYCERIPS